MQESVVEKVYTLQDNYAFLGREFLTWLWYYLEKNNYILKIPNLGDFRMHIDDKIVLTATGGFVRENSLKGNNPSYTTEAKLALQSGKFVEEVKLCLVQGDNEWKWVIRATDFCLKGIKLPSINAQTSDDVVAERLQYLEMLHFVMDFLYNKYLSLRLSHQFKNEISELREWVAHQ